VGDRVGNYAVTARYIPELKNTVPASERALGVRPELLPGHACQLTPKQAVTMLLRRWRGGDSRALDELVPIIYSELQRLAGRCLHSERPGHTLRATALTAAALHISPATVHRELKLAKAWLLREMEPRAS